MGILRLNLRILAEVRMFESLLGGRPPCRVPTKKNKAFKICHNALRWEIVQFTLYIVASIFESKKMKYLGLIVDKKIKFENRIFELKIPCTSDFLRPKIAEKKIV